MIGLHILRKGEKMVVDSVNPEFLFVTEGEIQACGYGTKGCVGEGQFINIPAKKTLHLSAKADTTVVVIAFDRQFRLFPSLGIDFKRQPADNGAGRSACCEKFIMNRQMRHYLAGVSSYMAEGITRRDFFEVKANELLFILSVYYPEFNPEILFYTETMSDNDAGFERQVLENMSSCHTVAELAESMNYSFSGFQKRFKKVFGTSPYKWMKEQKVDMLRRELAEGKKVFKEISEMMGFSSVNYLNEYCKRNFGMTPGQIRRRGGNKKSGNPICLIN